VYPNGKVEWFTNQARWAESKGLSTQVMVPYINSGRLVNRPKASKVCTARYEMVGCSIITWNLGEVKPPHAILK
jgi:hypothetical protein